MAGGLIFRHRERPPGTTQRLFCKRTFGPFGLKADSDLHRDRGPDVEVNLMSRKDAILSMRQVLVKRRDALRKALAGDLSLLKEMRAQTSGDMVDAALDSVQDEISSQLAEVESRELTRIEYALERMRSGQFGICEGCNTAIPMARLNALPYATYCIKCQREAERQGGSNSSSADVDWSRLLDSSGGDADLSINDIELDVS
jgi:DnaK suppressor protein